MTEKTMSKAYTPVFRVSYPNVFESRLNDMNGKMEFSILMLIPKGSDISSMKKLAQAAVFKKWGDNKPANLKSPFRDGDEERSDKPEYKGQIFVTAKSQQRPGLVDESANKIMDKEDFYPGCYAQATVTAYAYDQKGNRGVAFGLLNLQKVNDGEPLTARSKVEDEFAPLAKEAKDDSPEDDGGLDL